MKPEETKILADRHSPQEKQRAPPGRMRERSTPLGVHVAGGMRFSLYRFLMGLVQARDSGNERMQVEPLAPELPRLYRATHFPASEHAEKRHKRSVRSKPLLDLVGRIAPRRTAPIPSDQSGSLDAVYPPRYRKLWLKPPAIPLHLQDDPDRLVSLALRGPFAGYLMGEGTAGLVALAAWLGSVRTWRRSRRCGIPSAPPMSRSVPRRLPLEAVGSCVRARSCAASGRVRGASTDNLPGARTDGGSFLRSRGPRGSWATPSERRGR